MDLPATFAFFGAVWWATSGAIRIGAYAAAFIAPLRRRRRASAHDQPPVTIVIPVRRLEAEAAEALASAFTQDYPQVEVITAAEETQSPALELAREVAARFPPIVSRIIAGIARFTPNPKVSNLAAAVAAARHDLILAKDSNIRLDHDQLAELARHRAPGVGLVCAVPIATMPGCFGAEIERAFINGQFAPMLFAASLLGLDIAVGKTMLFDRRDLHRAGGIAAMAPAFGDDNALGKALARIGLRTVYAAKVARQPLGRRSLRDVLHRQQRWMVIRRTQEPLAFVAEPLTSCAFTALAGAAGAPIFGLPAGGVALATVAGWLALESVVVATKGWGWSWRFPLAGLCRELLIPVLWSRALLAREVRWAGRRVEVPRAAAPEG